MNAGKGALLFQYILCAFQTKGVWAFHFCRRHSGWWSVPRHTGAITHADIDHPF